MLLFTYCTETQQQDHQARGSYPQEYFSSLEEVEVAFWNDLYEVAPKAGGGVLHRLSIGSASAFLVPSADVLGLNKVLSLGLAQPAQEDELAWIKSAYRDAGVPRFFIQVSPAAGPSALYDWLADAGLCHYNNWVKLLRPLEAPVPTTDTHLRVECIGRNEAEDFGTMIAAAFDWPPVLAQAIASTIGRPEWRHYFAYDGDVPVAGAALFVQGCYAYLGPAATRVSHRRKGAQRALIARRLQDAVILGCHTAITDTAEDRSDRPVASYRNMRYMGFIPAYARPNFIFQS